MHALAGKVAIITGAASGIGKGMAEAFVSAKMKVVLSDIERGPLDETTRALRAVGGEVHSVVTDVADLQQVERLAQETLEVFGATHVLCNNAGVVVDSRPSWRSTRDDWNWILGVNLMGVVHGMRAFLPIMLQQNTEAHIVNTASIASMIYGENTLYATTKAAVVALSEGTHLELKRRKQKPNVSVLCPSFVQSNILSSGRNRPGFLADTGPLPKGLLVDITRQWAKKQFENGLSARAVGDQVLSGILNEQFYIFTHANWLPIVEQRMQHILAGKNPEIPDRPGDAILRSMIDGAPPASRK
jgi:NAD(P)-dependent dehydrogenase (short-subunit alcohol dehydrogenase family)